MYKFSKMAILFTCYNRKEYSVRCVKSLLKAAKEIPEIDCFFYIWDDGSTDDTVESLRFLNDRVRVFEGPGDYYWSKSMYHAMYEAVKGDYDLYLMVNDDVEFYSGAIRTMIDSYILSGYGCGIVGSTRYNGVCTYGGNDRNFKVITPSGALIKCKYSNWNCFLLDRDTVNKVGLISPKYAHAAGDFDYSCRMNKAGFCQYIATDYVGECDNDHPIPTYYDRSRTLGQRFKALASPKGQPIGSFYRLHWVDKQFKGLIIASFSYFLIIVRIVFPIGTVDYRG